MEQVKTLTEAIALAGNAEKIQQLASAFAETGNKRDSQLLAMELFVLFNAAGYIAEANTDRWSGSNYVEIFHSCEPSPRDKNRHLAQIWIEKKFSGARIDCRANSLGARPSAFKASAFRVGKLAGGAFEEALVYAWKQADARLFAASGRLQIANEALLFINPALSHRGLVAEVLAPEEAWKTLRNTPAGECLRISTLGVSWTACKVFEVTAKDPEDGQKWQPLLVIIGADSTLAAENFVALTRPEAPGLRGGFKSCSVEVLEFRPEDVPGTGDESAAERLGLVFLAAWDAARIK